MPPPAAIVRDSAGSADTLAALGGLLAGLLFSAAAFHFWRSHREMRSRGITTQALVLRKFRRGDGLENYYAQVAFHDQKGVEHTVELKILSKAWRRVREGATEQVTYLPGAQPQVRLGPKWGLQLLGLFLLLFMLVGAGLAIAALLALL